MTQDMPITESFTIQNEYGLHARPAALFVKCCARFDAAVEVEKDGVSVSGKSIMGLLTLEGTQGSVLTITAEGPQAAEVMAAIRDLFETHFGE